MGSSRNQPQGNLRTFDIFGEVEICVLSGLCRDDSYPPTYFKCRRTLLNKLIPRDHIHGSEREIKFRRCLFTFSMKREISHFYVVVLQKGQRNVQKSVMHVQRVLLCLLNIFFFDVLVAFALLHLKVPPGVLRLIFAGYGPLTSRSTPTPRIIVYSLAKNRPHLSRFRENVILAIPT